MIKYLFTLVFAISSAYAHPHTFIEVFPTITVKDNKTQNIHFRWSLDEMTSSMLIVEFDQNADGKLDNQESQYAYENFFSTLKEFNFYTDVVVKDQTEFFPKPINFKASIQDNKICYDFDIEKQYNIKELKFDFGDTEFFVAMVLKEEFTKITGAKAKVSELDNDFYFGYRLELE
jgi:ABC-type uncharacterized transport system substrate-binding protein